MKKLTIAILTFVLLAAATLSAEAQTKVASVDMKKLFNGSWKFKQSSTILEDRKTSHRKELKSMADDLDKISKEYKQLLEQANDPLISADEREKRKSAAAGKSKDVNNAKVALEQYQRQAETSLVELEQRLSSNLVAEIQKKVTARAKAGGYTTVINTAATEVVVYADPAGDITESVLKDLNADAPPDWLKSTGSLPATLKPNSP
jgi:outer membrane protein